MAITTESLSFAQSLRVIGQDLDKLQPNSLILEKSGDEYLVRIKRTESSGKSSQRGVVTWIIEKILGSEDVVEESPEIIRFTISEILWSDTQKRVKRSARNGMPMHNLSMDLRALGDYLDRKRAGNFAIRWSRSSAMVSYGNHEEYFTTENLHDLGINMYLRRITRERPN
jgi:hypothetical protein